MKKPSEFIDRANELAEESTKYIIELDEDASKYDRDYITTMVGKTASYVAKLAHIASHLLRMKAFVAGEMEQAELRLKIAECDVRESDPWKKAGTVRDREHILIKTTMLESTEVGQWKVAKLTISEAIGTTQWVHNAVKQQDSDLRLQVRLLAGPGEQYGDRGIGAIGPLKYRNDDGDEPVEIT